MQLHTLVSNTVHKFGESTAVIYDDGENSQSMTYSLLWKNVEQISSFLSSHQIADKTVAVVLNQSLNIPAILLGILCNRCCYFPLAIDNGKKFIFESIKRSGASWIIHDSSTKEVLSYSVEQLHGKYIDISSVSKFHINLVQLESDFCKAGRTSDQSSISDGKNMAYCITTSGTTGHPKVIRVPHSCIVPNIIDFSKIFQMNEKDTVLLSAPLTFDPSIVDIFLALSNGAALLIVPNWVKKSPSQLVNVLHSRQNVTVLQATPSLIRRCSSLLLRQTIFGPNSTLRVLALGGEQFPSQSELKEWVHPSNKTHTYNLYGITEVSCWASCELVNVHHIIETNDVVSLGNPLSKTVICVDSGLESDKEPISQGQICIGSSERICILDNSDHNNILEHHASGDGCIVWRNTGDIGRVLEDGRIVFVGREDDQIKRHGKRMTLSSVEVVCCQLPWISQCCALMNKENQLIIFYVPQENLRRSTKFDNPENVIHGNNQTGANCQKSNLGDNKLSCPNDDQSELMCNERRGGDDPLQLHDHHKCKDLTELTLQKGNMGHTMEERILRTHIADCLPSQYSPDTVLRIEAFPMTSHGKLDKKKLLDIEKDTVQNIGLIHESPISWLSHLWMTYLPKNIEKIKMTDTFLSLGGDSLAAVNLVNQIDNVLDGCLPGHFVDTLFNNTFSACVEILQNCLKNDASAEGSFATANTNSKKTVPKIREFEIGKKDSFKGELKKRKEIFVVEKEESNNMSNKSPTPLYKFSNSEIGPNHLIDSHCGHKENTMVKDLCKVGVIGRGNRMMKGGIQKQVDSGIGDKHKHQIQQQQCNLDGKEYQENHMKTDTTTGSHQQRTSQNNVFNSSLHTVETIGVTPKTFTSVDKRDYCRKRAKEHKDRSDFNQINSPSDFATGEPQEFLSNELHHLGLKWTLDTEKCVDASPVVAVLSLTKHLVFIGSHSGHFSGVDLNTGKKLWMTVLPDRIESSACVTRNMSHVVVGCYNGIIYVMDVHTGNVDWEFPTGSCVKCSPCLDEGTGHVICGSHDGCLYSLDVEKKSCAWKHFLGGGSIYSSPVSDPKSGLVFAASLSGKLVALNSVDGCPMWCTDLKKPLFSSPCLHDVSVLIGCVDGNLYCIDRTDGHVEWIFKTQGPVFSSPVSQKGRIFFGSHDSQFYCLTSDGKMIWKFSTSSPIFSTPFTFQVCTPKSSNNQSHCQLPCLQTETTEAEPKSKMARKGEQEEERNSHLFLALSNLKSSQYGGSNDTLFKSQNVHNDSLVNKDFKISNESNVNQLDIVYNIDSRVNSDNLKGILHEEIDLVMFASTEGTLYIMESENGRLVTSTNFNGEVFSSPVFHNGKIVVGCRDNLLYCFDFYL